jgi:aspartyl-tRNA(Asn)/glutamyl-tRNA(Gln) amidotransferase subunit B
MADYQKLEAVIGLEIHVQLNTRSKMFCSCPNDPQESQPNTNICPTCLGHPGTLPVANEAAVKKLVQAGLALNCQIPTEAEFARKSYFYPDLPKGYQISQADHPLCQRGQAILKNQRKIRIRRIHLEEDTGRLIHDNQKNCSLIDFNRAGVPLMELVTEPDFKNGDEVTEFAQELQLILRYLGVSEADMEKGEMRIEANISVQPKEAPLGSGTKTELKNINSFRAVRMAIDSEIERQRILISQGGQVVQETRGWDGQKTIRQRKKEAEQEYRYFPEPDLLPIRWRPQEIDEIRQSLPELPAAKRRRFAQEYKLVDQDIEVFVREPDLGKYFEKTASELLSWMKDENVDSSKTNQLIKLLANYLISDLKGLLGSQPLSEIKITPENFAELIVLVFQDKVPSRLAKDLLKEMFQTGGDPSRIMDDQNIVKIDDEKTLVPVVKKIIDNNPQACQDYRKGKLPALQFLIGQLMGETKGSVEPEVARRLIESALNSEN